MFSRCFAPTPHRASCLRGGDDARSTPHAIAAPTRTVPSVAGWAGAISAPTVIESREMLGVTSKLGYKWLRVLLICLTSCNMRSKCMSLNLSEFVAGCIGIHVHEWAVRRLPYCREMGAATGTRHSAFQPVFTRYKPL